MNKYSRISKVYEDLRKLCTDNKYVIYTAVQIQNPNAKLDRAEHFGPSMVILDYMKIL